MGSTICWCPSPPSPVCRSYFRKGSSQQSSPVGTRNRLRGRGRCSMAIPNTLPHWGFFPPLTDILVELRKLGRLFACHGFLSHPHSVAVTTSQKPSLVQ